MKLKMGKEHVIVQGIKPEEQLWGSYQFPTPFNLGDRIVVSVHVSEDDINSFGNPCRWFESRDEGETWQEINPDSRSECGLKLPNGDLFFIERENAINLDGYKFPTYHQLTPGYDFSKPAPEGEMPIQDGVQAWWCGNVINAYNADRLPPSLREKRWLISRIKAGETTPTKEYAELDWPYLTRVVFMTGFEGKMMKSLFPMGSPKLGPDGAIWVAGYSGEGHLNPENGQYSPYYSAEIFRSTDNGKTFCRHSHMEYEADGHEFPYQSGGFSDSDFEFMDDGSMVWFLRTAWMGSTGYEWAPMYVSRSFDMGKTWTKPEKFAETGILPRLCKLNCGVTMLCYARPGIFVQACKNDDSRNWCEPLVVMTPEDRSALANVQPEVKTFHDWDGACNNPQIIPLNDDTALLFYSDFYYPDKNGVKRKSILCRKITVEF